MHGPQRVLQLVDLPVAGLGVVALADDVALHPPGAGPLPLLVGAVDPGEDHVDRERHLADEVREHVPHREPGAAVALDLVEVHVLADEAAAGERVRRRHAHLGAAAHPELEAHGVVGAQGAGRVDPRPDDREQPLVAARQLAVGDEHRTAATGEVALQGHRVAGLLGAGDHEGALHGHALGLVDDEDRAVSVVAHEQHLDAGLGERVGEEQQVGDLGVVGGLGAVDQGQEAVLHHHVGPAPDAGGRGRQGSQLRAHVGQAVPPRRWQRSRILLPAGARHRVRTRRSPGVRSLEVAARRGHGADASRADRHRSGVGQAARWGRTASAQAGSRPRSRARGPRSTPGPARRPPRRRRARGRRTRPSRSARTAARGC